MQVDDEGEVVSSERGELFAIFLALLHGAASIVVHSDCANVMAQYAMGDRATTHFMHPNADLWLLVWPLIMDKGGRARVMVQ